MRTLHNEHTDLVKGSTRLRPFDDSSVVYTGNGVDRRIPTAPGVPELHVSRKWWALPALAGLILLNAALTFSNIWPTPKVRLEYALSIELAACVCLLAAAGARAAAWFRTALPGLFVLLVLGHYVDVTAPGLYGRDFNVYWDSQHLLNVAAMLTGSVPAWQIGLVVFSAVAVIAAAFFLARLVFRMLQRALDDHWTRRALGTFGGASICLFAMQASVSVLPPGLFSDPVIPSFARQARYVVSMIGPRAVLPLGSSPEMISSELRGLKGADVILVFLESYGAVTYDHRDFRAALDPRRSELAVAAQASGKDIVSAFVESPTFGGSSWLAHLSFLSGVEVRDPYAYSSLMVQQRPTLVSTFAMSGYRTVAMMPGLRQPWPEGAFYGFDRIYQRNDLEYRGPEFGWWSIPDQYTLAKLDALEWTPKPRAPVFAVFPTSTTHTPFGPVAPYQPDWSRMLGAEAFSKEDVERALAEKPDLMNLGPSYVRAMAYEFATLSGYVREHAGDDMVLIIVGDHQPPAAVSGKDAPWSVPVHVVAREGPILEKLVAGGFHRGVTPPRASIGSMHELLPLLLEAFGAVRHETTTGPRETSGN